VGNEKKIMKNSDVVEVAIDKTVCPKIWLYNYDVKAKQFKHASHFWLPCKNPIEKIW
jgi:hypothetical protein